jgi:hypothetical protein
MKLLGIQSTASYNKQRTGFSSLPADDVHAMLIVRKTDPESQCLLRTLTPTRWNG